MISYPVRITDPHIKDKLREIIDAVNTGAIDHSINATAIGKMAQPLTLKQIQQAIQIGGSNPINVTGLQGTLANPQTSALIGLISARPLYSSVPQGTLYYAYEQSTAYVASSTNWDTISRRILIGGFYGIFAHANSADRTYTFPNASGNIPFTPSSALAANILIIGSSGTLPQLDTLGTPGSDHTVLHGSTGAAAPPGFSAVDLTQDVSGVLPVANGGTGIAYDRVVQVVALTNQTTTIGPTTIASAGSQFRFSYTLLDTATDVTAGSIQLSTGYTDDQGATTQAGASISLVGLARDRGVFVIQRASGNVTYTVTLTGIIGGAKYAVYACLERLS